MRRRRLLWLALATVSAMVTFAGCDDASEPADVDPADGGRPGALPPVDDAAIGPGIDAAAPDGGWAPLRVVVVSDLNGSYGSTSYAASVTNAVKRTIALAPD